eukprot:TRINITY_DN4341_c0_g3_i1.p1 TRINITY_DN4341_c0_g3~~TRINITY_DN4341_c0_g3_i1.p1  ORF type:complete len:324 (+),score=8.78 TRINITY_DN4341_c0_g3_i1:116-973(+)
MYSDSGYRSHDDKLKKVKDPLVGVINWYNQSTVQQKFGLLAAAACFLLLILYFILEDHDVLFILSETSHFLGIGILVYKLLQKKTCAGLSLRTQILTATFLSIRLFCSFLMEFDIHTLLDFLTLAATLWVVYMVYFKLRHTWQKEQDSIRVWWVILPCVILALLVHPRTSHNFGLRLMWSFCVYLEAIAVYPQLRMMQNNKVVERFTAHYVFALGLSRFFSCAHWILQIIDGRSFIFNALGYGLWPLMVLLSEIVQTFILADFCYFYVQSYAKGTGVVRLPTGIV